MNVYTQRYKCWLVKLRVLDAASRMPNWKTKTTRISQTAHLHARMAQRKRNAVFSSNLFVGP